MVIDHNLLVGSQFAQDSCMPDDNDVTSVTSITLKHTLLALINRLGKLSLQAKIPGELESMGASTVSFCQVQEMSSCAYVLDYHFLGL